MKNLLIFVIVASNLLYGQKRDTLLNNTNSLVIMKYSISGDDIYGEIELINKSKKRLIISKNNDKPFEYIFHKYNYDGSMVLLIGYDTRDFLSDMTYLNCTPVKPKASVKISFLLNKKDVVDKKSISNFNELKIVYSFAGRKELVRVKSKNHKILGYNIYKSDFEKNAIRIRANIPMDWKD